MSTAGAPPSPALIMDTLGAYQRTAALKAAVELELFTAIGEGSATAVKLATRCGASERGIRILSDYLALQGFLTKDEQRYALTTDSAAFLDSRSPTYMGGMLEFLLAPEMVRAFDTLPAAVRTGTSQLPGDGSMAPENPVWVKFARAMVPLVMPAAQKMAALVGGDPRRELKVLDIAAGHGIFGITIARQYPNARIVAQDWANVLEVARENAAHGVSDRWTGLPGSAFDVDYGTGYDLVLLTNFLHHFDATTNQELLRKVHASLAPDGRAFILDFVPNEDRISPPWSAGFPLTMLASTPSGDAYTFSELQAMCKNAGFSEIENHSLAPTAQTLIIAHRGA